MNAELDRLQRADPFRALQLGYEATEAQIRARFLAITKQYHPSRYARMERDVFRAANEVFLKLKEAYSALSDPTKRERLRARYAPAAPLRPKTPTPDRASERTDAAAPDSNGGATQRGPAVAPPRPKTATNRRPVRRPAPTGPKVGTRPATRVPRTAVTERGAPVGTPRRPATTTGQMAAAAQDTVRRRSESYEQGLKLASIGRYAEARKVFHKIAAEDPKTKKYRLQLHYTWGLEHEDAGQIEDARAEFQRAIQVDPEFKRAHEALDRLPGGKKGGFFSKIFGR